VACFTNSGVGIGSIADNFVSLDDPTKWILVLTMLGGRLEIFTLLVLFTPAFWRK
jgi:trk system potassium uptake protein TrkH